MKLDYEKILSLMMKKQMTKKMFLDAAGISDFTLASIRKGKKCRASTAQLIADALGVDPEELEAEEAPEQAAVRMEEIDAPEKLEMTIRLEEPELPDALTEALNTIKQYGESEYQRGKNEMGVIFLKAVKEAIDRWNEIHKEGAE